MRVLKYIFYAIIVLEVVLTSFKSEATDNWFPIQRAYPRAGVDAYWVENPINPSQKILLVPCVHELNLKLFRPDVVQDIKSCDVLFEETECTSYDDSLLIQSMLREGMSLLFPPLETLRATGLVKDKPFMCEDTPWTQSSYLSEERKQFMATHVSPLLSGVPLENWHPCVIRDLLERLDERIIRYLYGAEQEIWQYFKNNNKTCLPLESLAEAVGRSSLMATAEEVKAGVEEPIMKHTIALNDVCSINITEKLPLDLCQHMAQAFIEERIRCDNTDYAVKELAQKRNRNWANKLEEFIQANPQKSIAVLVGSYHFSGFNTFLDFLEGKGYKSRKYPPIS